MTDRLPPLAAGNRDFRAGRYTAAMQHFVRGLFSLPELRRPLAFNAWMARDAEQAAPRDLPRVVLLPRLAGTACRRARKLHELMQGVAQASLCVAEPVRGREKQLQKLQGGDVACHVLQPGDALDAEAFARVAALHVAAHPCEVVHLVQPDTAALLLAALYKLIWNAAVIADLPEHPLAEASLESRQALRPAPVDLWAGDWPQQRGDAPPAAELIAGWLGSLDGLTVANGALLATFGGVEIPDAPAGDPLPASPAARAAMRARLEMAAEARAVLLSVAPHHQAGVEVVADAVRSLGAGAVLVVQGELPEAERTRLAALPGLDCRFLAKPEAVPMRKLALAFDLCIVAGASDALRAATELSPRLLPALAAGLAVVAAPGTATQDLEQAGALLRLEPDVPGQLARLLADPTALQQAREAAAGCMQRSHGPAAARAGLQALLAHLSTHRGAQAAPLRKLVFHGPARALLPLMSDGSGRDDRPPRRLPIKVLVLTWDVGHNPLGRSYMLAEVLQRVCREVVLAGFQFPRFGDQVWEPVREGRVPLVVLPGTDLPAFQEALPRLAERIQPDIVIACKPRLPSLALGLAVKERWGCPLVVDVDDHELSFFKDRTPLPLAALEELAAGALAGRPEPFEEPWTRLAHTLCEGADEVLVSNQALQQEFGGTLVPHVRDEEAFIPERFDRDALRAAHGIGPEHKVVLFFGTARAHKGIEAVAAAIGRIADPQVRLVVVGDVALGGRRDGELEALAAGRMVRLPRQPFDAIPAVLAMADLVCLPQDESHAISQFQLPAKAIDAVAMGVPLLVSRTAPLMALVADRVARPLDMADIAGDIERALAHGRGDLRRQTLARRVFLKRYSYEAAAETLRQVLWRALHTRRKPLPVPGARLLAAVRHGVGAAPPPAQPAPHAGGLDVVLFWKQNDTGLYGRRHDMVIQYLASRPDVRKVVVFDSPASELDLQRKLLGDSTPSQHRWVYLGSHGKRLGLMDTEKVRFDVFLYPPGTYRPPGAPPDERPGRPALVDAYATFVAGVLRQEGVDPARCSLWLYPRNVLGPALVERLRPAQVVVDVVDDNRTGPRLDDEERQRVMENYRDTLALADAALANCETVQASMRGFFPAIQLVPNAFDPAPPARTPRGAAFAEFLAWPGPTLGYIGNLEAKLDLALLERLATELPHCQLVLVGSAHTNPEVLALRRFPNVRMPGVVPYAEAGAWVSHFDVGLLPHLDTEQTRSMNPLKVFTYVAWAVPVVATAVSNLETGSGLVRVVADHAAFVAAVRDTLARGRPPRDTAAAHIAAHAWPARLAPAVDAIFARHPARAPRA